MQVFGLPGHVIRYANAASAYGAGPYGEFAGRLCGCKAAD
jgi:hypothetical protein